MRIALFAHRLAQRHPTGIGRYLVELARSLDRVAAADTQLVLASTREAEAPSWVPSGVATEVVAWPRRPVQLAWCLGSGPRVDTASRRASVVHLVQPFPPVRSGAPQVATVHDLFPFEHPDWYHRSERWTYRRSLELITRRAARLVVPSAYAAEQLSSLLGVDATRIEVVHLGVSGAFGSDSAGGDDAVCRRFGVVRDEFAISVGAVSTRKNLVAVIRALAELGPESIPLLLVGPDGVGVEAVEGEIRRLRGSARVLRTGFVPDADAAALVRSARVLVHPTLGEGFGFVPLEAMAVRTPVIAAGVSAVPEVVGNAARLVDAPTEPAAWASALRELIDDPGRREALVRAGEERARSFSWDGTAARMLRIYADVAGA